MVLSTIRMEEISEQVSNKCECNGRFVKRLLYILWMIFECAMMFWGTFVLLANIHIVIPQLKLREWSIEFCVILPSVLVLWLTIYMQCNGYYTLKKKRDGEEIMVQHKHMRKLEGKDEALRAQHEDVPQGSDCGSETLKKKAISFLGLFYMMSWFMIGVSLLLYYVATSGYFDFQTIASRVVLSLLLLLLFIVAYCIAIQWEINSVKLRLGLEKEELLDHQSSKTPARKENDGK